MPLFTIHKVHPNAECFMTGKETQAVEFSTDDGNTVVVALKEFIKLLRLELKKVERPRPSSESNVPREPA